MKTTTVLLADDHEIFLAGLQKLLEADFDVVGAVADGQSLCEAARRLQPDVIVADISMPVLNGVDAVRSLLSEGCTAKMIFLSMHGDPLYQNEAMRTGASSYVLKRDAPDKLIAAIRGAVDASAVPFPAAGPHAPGAAPVLTPRQRQIWQLLAEGRVPKQIAATVGVSVRTVEFHKYRLMQRLGVHTVAELTVLAVKHRLIA
jgi:DNA-binding NarL/FixJ family response regulator